MTGEDWESMLARFRVFGATPSVARYLDLFDPDGTVQHPGMPHPLRGAAIGEFIEGALAAIPDFTLTPLRWCARDDLLFVEARCTGTVGERRVVWPALYRLITRAGRVLEGRASYDRAAVLAHTDAGLAARRDEPHTTILDNLIPDTAPAVHVDDPRVVSEFLHPYANTWSDPRPERFARFYLPGATVIEPLMRHPVTYPEITAHYRT
ncbi:MAG: nuclear transport factor 2 family protein, partial [Pseudonocardia sp.]|nr:nuclear transport factor 2 family protein [Pseudonocardia sp.]